jgi:signal recognition particle receptor subunit beta
LTLFRNLRKQSFEDYDAIIFVVDSADRNSFQEARNELWTFLSFAPDMMEHTVLLILANKQDLHDAASVDELHKVLNLKDLSRISAQVHVEPTCAVSGNGLQAALEWLTRTIKENRRKTVTTTYL